MKHIRHQLISRRQDTRLAVGDRVLAFIDDTRGGALAQYALCGADVVAGSTEPDVKGILMTALTWPFSRSGTVMLAKPKAEDLRKLIQLYQQGHLNITIDRTYPLADAADAHRRMETGVDRGKVVVQHRP